MLKRKPSKIQVKVDDKDELEEARNRAAAAASSATTGAALLFHDFDRSSKSHRIGLLS